MASGTPIVGKNDLLSQRPDIASEWDYERNYPLRPEQVVKGSGKKVYWLCNKGHSYQARIADRIINRGCPYCSNKKVLQGFNDIATTHPNVLKQWDYEKNGSLLPTMITYGSNVQIWWKCEKGHSWKIKPRDKAKRNTGCPFCINKKILSGYNDLALLSPDLIKEWDWGKNVNLNPSELALSSREKVWWLCPKGHSYDMSISSRTHMKCNCPYCAGKRVLKGFNDLESQNPKIASEWDYERNYPLTPQMVTVNSKKAAWFHCNNGFAHSYKTVIDYRTKQGTNCPYCAGRDVLPGFNDLASYDKELSRQWNYEKNGNLTPQMIYKLSSKKVWWKCDKGHEWEETPSCRIRHNLGCPYCSNKRVWAGYNDIASDPKYDYLVKEWDYEKNAPLTPQMVSYGSGKFVWWKCDKGHSWKAQIAKRTTSMRNCPICNCSHAELLCYQILKSWKISFKKEFGIAKNQYRFDFYLKDNNLFLEFDGLQHFKKDVTWKEVLPFDERVRRDNWKSSYAFEHNVPLLRIPYTYDPIKNKTDIERLLKDFIKTKRIPQEIIDFYAKYEFSNYADLARKWNAIRG